MAASTEENVSLCEKQENQNDKNLAKKARKCCLKCTLLFGFMFLLFLSVPIALLQNQTFATEDHLSSRTRAKMKSRKSSSLISTYLLCYLFVFFLIKTKSKPRVFKLHGKWGPSLTLHSRNTEPAGCSFTRSSSSRSHAETVVCELDSR